MMIRLSLHLRRRPRLLTDLLLTPSEVADLCVPIPRTLLILTLAHTLS